MPAKKPPKPKKHTPAPVQPAPPPVKAKNLGGRPTMYKPEYCAKLQEHLGKGYTIESFGAVVGTCRDTLRKWTLKHPDFAAAKLRGEAARELYLIRMGQGIAMGKHRFLKEERHVIDKETKQVVLGADGKPLIDKIYQPAHVNAAAWIFLCKNMLGWRDKKDVNVAGQPDGAPITVMTREERLAEIERLQAQRALCDDAR